jgi:hypothetical protein
MPADPGHLYRAPKSTVGLKRIEPRRILIIGSCLAEALPTTAIVAREREAAPARLTPDRLRLIASLLAVRVTMSAETILE